MFNPETEPTENGDTPSIYVDQDLLQHVNTVPPTQREPKTGVYKIDKDIFYEERCVDGEKLAQFEVYAQKVDDKMDEECDMYCSTPDSGSEYADDESDQPLKVTLQPVPKGYIINNDCFLTFQQWHTLMPTTLSPSILECAICGQYCEESDCVSHVASKMHEDRLERLPPLARNPLCVVRRIGNNYYCAVCNEIYKTEDEIEHANSKSHEENLLSSLNKASDLLDSAFSKPNTTETYQYRGFQNATSEENFGEEYDDEEILKSKFSYANIAKKPKVERQKYLYKDLGNKKLKVEFDSWHMVISTELNKIYCMVCKTFDHVRNKMEHCKTEDHLERLSRCQIVEAYEEYFIRQVDEKLYHCGHCNNLQVMDEMIDHVEVYHPRKTRLNLDNKSNPGSPLKTTKDRKTSTSEEKSDRSSVNSDKNNTKVKTDNNTEALSVKNATQSAADTKNHSDNSKIGQPLVKLDYQQNGETVMTNISNPASEKATQPSLPKTNGVNRRLNIFDVMEITLFNTKMILPVMSFNIICKRPSDYYCGLCDKLFEEKAIVEHLSDLKHVDLLNRTPFIRPYTFNLIRAIRDALHCTICNMPIDVDKISLHVVDRQHLASMYRALGFEYSPQLPTPGIPVPNNRLLPGNANVTPNNANIIPNIFHISPSNASTSNHSLSPNNRLPNMGSRMPTVSPTAVSNIMIPNSHVNTNIIPGKPYNFTGNANLMTGNSNTIPGNAHAIPGNINAIPGNANALPGNAHAIPGNVNALSGNAHAIPGNANAIPGNSNAIPGNISITPSNFSITPSNASSPYHTPNSMSPRATPNFNNPQFSPKRFETPRKNSEEKLQDLNGIVDKLEVLKHAGSDEDLPVAKDDNYSDVDENDENENEDLDKTLDSVASEDATFDFEEVVYLKLKNTYIKVSNTSYNTLVAIGDGTRYCFVCSLKVLAREIQKHVDCRSHLDNIEKYRFLDKYEDHLLRQIYLMYHCTICNVVIMRKDLKTHLEWSTHVLLNENTIKNLKKTRKGDIKRGVKQIVVFTQKENIYLHDNEPKVKIILDAIVKNETVSANATDLPENDLKRKNKIIILNNNVLKVSWEAWQGITKVKTGYKCVLCQKELRSNEIDNHCNSEWHNNNLRNSFDKDCEPALIREINDTVLNCLFCNSEVSKKPLLLAEHINGKKHLKNYNAILKESSATNTYNDCQDDVLML